MTYTGDDIDPTTSDDLRDEYEASRHAGHEITQRDAGRDLTYWCEDCDIEVDPPNHYNAPDLLARYGVTQAEVDEFNVSQQLHTLKRERDQMEKRLLTERDIARDYGTYYYTAAISRQQAAREVLECDYGADDAARLDAYEEALRRIAQHPTTIQAVQGQRPPAKAGSL